MTVGLVDIRRQQVEYIILFNINFSSFENM